MDNCPHCGSGQQGDPIPTEYLEKGYYGEWNGEPRHYSRTIMVEVQGVYDGGLYFACPDCGGKWHRWPEGHPLREKAKRYVEG